METRASYLIVGAFTLLGMLGLVVAIIWLANVEFDETYQQYDIYFEGSVTGLKAGNPVRYRGIPVGTVTDMRINPKNVEQVRVTIEVPVDTPIKSDAEASLELQGITGVAYVQISGGSNEATALEAEKGQGNPVIPSKPSQLEKLFETAPELLARFVAVADRIQMLMSTENIEAFSNTLANVEDVTAVLSERREDLSSLIVDGSLMTKDLRGAAAEARVTMVQLRELSMQMRDSLTTITGSLDSTLGTVRKELGGVGEETKSTMRTFRSLGDNTGESLAKVNAAADQVSRAARKMADFISTNEQSLGDFANEGLYELTQLLSEARVLITSLTRVSTQIENDPGRFLFGRSHPGVEVK